MGHQICVLHEYTLLGQRPNGRGERGPTNSSHHITSHAAHHEIARLKRYQIQNSPKVSSVNQRRGRKGKIRHPNSSLLDPAFVPTCWAGSLAPLSLPFFSTPVTALSLGTPVFRGCALSGFPFPTPALERTTDRLDLAGKKNK